MVQYVDCHQNERHQVPSDGVFDVIVSDIEPPLSWYGIDVWYFLGAGQHVIAGQGIDLGLERHGAWIDEIPIVAGRIVLGHEHIGATGNSNNPFKAHLSFDQAFRAAQRVAALKRDPTPVDENIPFTIRPQQGRQHMQARSTASGAAQKKKLALMQK